MVKPGMVGWMVHGYLANNLLKLFAYINKKQYLCSGFKENKLIFGTLRSDCVGCFVIYLA